MMRQGIDDLGRDGRDGVMPRETLVITRHPDVMNERDSRMDINASSC